MSDDTDKSDIVERLEAQAIAMDADLSDLGIVKKSDYEATQEEIESLRAENEALEADMEELREEITLVKEAYAEELSAVRGFDTETLVEKFELEELREEFEDEFGGVEELAEASQPEPKSGDVGETEELADEETPEDEESAEELQAEIDELEEKLATYEEMGWESNAQAVREELAELRGEA